MMIPETPDESGCWPDERRTDTIVDGGHERQEQFPNDKAARILPCSASLIAITDSDSSCAGMAEPADTHFIVPYPAGGSTDVGARVIADYLSRALGQQVVVENRTGGSGNIGFEFAAKSAPDGYTVLIAPDQVTSAPHVFKVSFDPLKDFVPVIQLSRQPVVLAVHPKLGVSTLAELIALAKQQPGLSYATSGVGSQQHMAAEWFAKIAGIKLEHVPYRGGGAGDQRSGRRPRRCSPRSARTPLIPHYKAGTLQAAGAEHGGAFAEPAGRADLPGGRHQGAGARPMARRARAGRHAAGDRGAAQRRDEQGARRCPRCATAFLQSAQEPVGGSAEQFGTLAARGFRQIRAAGEGPEYQR